MTNSQTEPDAAQPVSGPHLRYLDGWRGAAIACVLIGHFINPPGLNFGRLGVELFFVLSGRLMTEILFIKRCPLPTFFRRRVSRVWPALVTFILITSFVFSSPGRLHVPTSFVLAALTFTANYDTAVFGAHCGVLEHVWSLCIEEHTYLFLGLVAFLASRKGANAVALCLGGAILCILSGAFQTLVLHKDYYSVYWRTDARASSILLSSAFFLLLYRHGRISALFGASSPVLFGLAGSLLNLNYVPDYIKYSVGAASFAVAIGLIDRADGWVLAFLNNPVLVRLGLYSFSLYLWQQPFFQTAAHYYAWMVVAGLAGCALASYYLVESPARRLLNAYWAPKPVKKTDSTQEILGQGEVAG